MTVPSLYIHASRDFERFLLDAREALSLPTTNAAYAAVLAVLVAFRARLTREDAGNPSPGWEKGRDEGVPLIIEVPRSRYTFS